MHPDYLEILNRRFEIKENEGSPKVIPLSEAIKRFVKPGMTLHFGVSHCRPNGISDEIARQFWGQRPGFTLAMLGVVGNSVVLVYGKLIKKVMSTFFGDSYPTPGPHRVFQEAYRNGTVELEQWTILTYPLRLLAGAMGIPWIPTRSIAGSSMEKDNADSFAIINDPREPDKKIGMVRALNPDLSFFHAWCADEAGNVLMTPPYGENVFGPLAAKEGAIVTVERIVTTDFIRKHAHLVKIPGYVVKSVSVCPMGVHPSGLTNIGTPEFTPYAEDYEFIEEHRAASKKNETYDAWIRHWILDCPDRKEYLSKLGHKKIFYLRGKAAPDSWRSEIEDFSDNLDCGEKSNGVERMIVASGRMLMKSIREKGYKTILAGVGASNLAAWLATLSLKEEGVEIECMAEIGFYGYIPRPSDPYIFNHRNVHTCKILTSIDSIIGMFTAGASGKCIGVLGAAQVDRMGNINSTCIPPAKVFITGSGGANDVASGAAEVLVCLEQNKNRLPERVPYISSPGPRVKTLVTDLGIFEKIGPDEEFTLTAIHADDSGRGVAEKLDEIRARTGWEIKIAGEIKEEPYPTKEELLTLRLCDPKRQFIGPAIPAKDKK